MLSSSPTETKYQSNVVFEFGINKKQDQFHDDIMRAVARQNEYRYFFYGGAIRGGKTSVCLVTDIRLCKLFPGSRWHIIRDSFTTLEATTIPSLERFAPESDTVHWNRNKSNFHLTFFDTGGAPSKLFLASESYFQDPDLNWMDGLETNGITLEQMEGLTEKLFEKAKERVGSWYINPMPPGIIKGTFNPSQTWTKEKIYIPHTKGQLKAPYYFLEALPTDNPKVTQDQWEGWKNLDPVSYARYIQGNWDAVENKNRFMTAYDPDKHESMDAKRQDNKQLYIITDFNINPFAINFAHIWHDNEGDHIHIFDEADIYNGSVEKWIELVKMRYEAYLGNCVLTGDKMGDKSVLERSDNASNYLFIQRGLRLRPSQIQTYANPLHENSRADCNYVLYHHPDFKINPETCPNTCRDMKIVQADHNGKIIKSNRDKTAQLADHLDNMRYLVNHTVIQEWKRQHSKGLHLYKSNGNGLKVIS